MAKQDADFAGTNADVTGGDIDIRSDVTIKLLHERLAETTDFTR